MVGTRPMDVFVSHSSQDGELANRIERDLEAGGLKVWLDHSDIRGGELLGRQLQQAILDCRVLVLLWSVTAAASRWVNLEWLAAFHQSRFIVPCVVDSTPLPFFLEASVYLDLDHREYGGVLPELKRTVGAAPERANELPPNVRALSAEVRAATAVLVELQAEVVAALQAGDLLEAAALQQALGGPIREARQRWPFEARIANLEGYYLKDQYQISYRDEIYAGRAPDDPVLGDAERTFIASLALDPTDPSALNGLGNILFFRRDLFASEFFTERAVHWANALGTPYPDAVHDLKMVRGHIAASERSATQGEERSLGVT